MLMIYIKDIYSLNQWKTKIIILIAFTSTNVNILIIVISYLPNTFLEYQYYLTYYNTYSSHFVIKTDNSDLVSS